MKAKERRQAARQAVELERKRNFEEFEFTEEKRDVKKEELQRRRIRHEKQNI